MKKAGVAGRKHVHDFVTVICEWVFFFHLEKYLINSNRKGIMGMNMLIFLRYQHSQYAMIAVEAHLKGI